MKRNPVFLIRKSPAEMTWLDGYDGREYEWTNFKATAWRFSTMGQAIDKLKRVSINHKDALIEGPL